MLIYLFLITVAVQMMAAHQTMNNWAERRTILSGHSKGEYICAGIRDSGTFEPAPPIATIGAVANGGFIGDATPDTATFFAGSVKCLGVSNCIDNAAGFICGGSENRILMGKDEYDSAMWYPSGDRRYRFLSHADLDRARVQQYFQTMAKWDSLASDAECEKFQGYFNDAMTRWLVGLLGLGFLILIARLKWRGTHENIVR